MHAENSFQVGKTHFLTDWNKSIINLMQILLHYSSPIFNYGQIIQINIVPDFRYLMIGLRILCVLMIAMTLTILIFEIVLRFRSARENQHLRTSSSSSYDCTQISPSFSPPAVKKPAKDIGYWKEGNFFASHHYVSYERKEQQ